MRSIATRLAMLGLALATVGCDRVTKHFATRLLEGEPARSYLGDTVRVTYAFNVADVGVMLGAFLLLVAELRSRSTARG